MSVDLTGQAVATVQCDAALTVTTDDGWFLTVENDYEFAHRDGRLLRTVDGDEEVIVAELERAVGSQILAFNYQEGGEMSLEVPAGTVHVSASPDFESWNLVGPEKQRIVSMPGGQLAVWS